MKATRHLLAVTLLVVIANTPAFAHGDVKCDTPKAERRGQMELQSKLVAEGWKVRKVKVENGCYEVYGFDPKGQKAEAFFDPKTFERVMPAGEAAPK